MQKDKTGEGKVRVQVITPCQLADKNFTDKNLTDSRKRPVDQSTVGA